MIRESFNEGWEFRPKVSPFSELGGAAAPYQPVTLPHDALIGQDRVPPDGHAQSDGGAGAYFPGGAFEYRKTFSVPEEYRGRRILLEFEGVYRDAMVYINGDYAGQRPYGYSLFRIDADRFLRCGRDNQIRVEARAQQGLPLVHRRGHLPRRLAADRRPGPDRAGRRACHHARHRRRAGGRRGRDPGRERLDRDQDAAHPHRDPRRRRERRRGRRIPGLGAARRAGHRAAAPVRPRARRSGARIRPRCTRPG